MHVLGGSMTGMADQALRGPATTDEASRRRAALTAAAPAAAVAIAMVVLARSVTFGADARWLAALGKHIATTGRIPVGVPFAAADSSSWANVPVLGELVFYGIDAVGDWALPAALVLAAGTLLALLALEARSSGAGSLPTAATVIAVTCGALPTLGIVRAQLLAFVPAALLVVLLRRQHERPTRAIWLAVPLLVVWGNLHGSALVGVALLGAYLVASRIRVPGQAFTAVAVGLVGVLALAVNPAHVNTWRYYTSVLTNEAATRRQELWAPPSLDRPFDVTLIGVACVLILAVALSRAASAWEWVAIVGLGAGTLLSARNGFWLLVILFVPAALAFTRLAARGRAGEPGRHAVRLRPVDGVLVGLAALASVAMLAVRGGSFVPATLVDSVASQSTGMTVLAPGSLAEDLAAGGVRVWMSNPIDAFDRSDQADYLDYWHGVETASRVLEHVDVVVARTGSEGARLAMEHGFDAVAKADGYVVMKRHTTR
ncbi:hypothetical protein [Intrasporangium mesophilum]